MAEPDPSIEPYAQGLLEVGEGNRIYWEACGNPAGKPALVVHGGPGSGCGTGSRRYFDPDRYRVILFDQRGCGRSVPHASDPTVDMSVNTTRHLLADMERLREYLGVERWLLYGGSWGCSSSKSQQNASPASISTTLRLDANHMDLWRSKDAWVGAHIGAELTGGSMYELEPGDRLWPYHTHHANEEWVLARGRPRCAT